MALKTRPTNKDPKKVLASISDDSRRQDAFKLLELFEAVTKEKGVLWGTSIIGFGQYHYKSNRSKQEGDWPLTGFAIRAKDITLYVMPGFENMDDLLEKLGPHKQSVGCLYLKRLSDVHLPTLRSIIKRSVNEMKRRYPHS